MNLFTRELFLLPSSADKDREWRNAMMQSCSKMVLVEAKYGLDLLFLKNGRLHDGKIVEVNQPTHENVVITIDGSGCTGGTGLFELEYETLGIVEFPTWFVGSIWLYSDIDEAGDFLFDFHTLYHPNSLDSNHPFCVAEFSIRARSAVFRVVEPGPRPVVGINVMLAGDGGFYVWDAAVDEQLNSGWIFLCGESRTPRRPSDELLQRARELAEQIGGIVAGDE